MVRGPTSTMRCSEHYAVVPRHQDRLVPCTMTISANVAAEWTTRISVCYIKVAASGWEANITHSSPLPDHCNALPYSSQHGHRLGTLLRYDRRTYNNSRNCQGPAMACTLINPWQEFWQIMNQFTKLTYDHYLGGIVFEYTNYYQVALHMPASSLSLYIFLM
ncbi:hypothetical protein BC835DRAFT_430565 [Cytidiella melzeri]|nr:hypothetical protein BC835DRAFT_430565 [Cytidiella melzeri]